MFKRRVDNNHGEVKKGLQDKGFEVVDTHTLGGFVDLVVERDGFIALVEIKSEGGKLTKSQKKLKISKIVATSANEAEIEFERKRLWAKLLS